VLLAATGVLCLAASALPLFPATADEELGSGFGSFSLAANAPVLQARVDDGGQCAGKPVNAAPCEGVLNMTNATLRNGPIGYALSSVGWPGTLGANLGTLAVVLGAPPEATALNYPVRAENSISGKDDTVTNSTMPGTVMSATATDAKVEAKASVGLNQPTPLGNLGSVSSWSRTSLTGKSTAEAVAHSEVQNLSLGGVITIEAVVSDAKATTDGTKAVATGRTRVTGAAIGGIPVTIDERGVSVAGTSIPGLGDAQAAVNAALSQAGMTIAVSTPIGKPEGSSVTYNAGALNVIWQPDAKTTLSLLIGGAGVVVASSEGYDFDLGGGPTDPGTAVPAGGTPVETTVPPAFTGGTATGPDLGGTPVPPAVTAPVTNLDTTPVAASSALPHGLSPWYGVLAALGAGLIMAGLRRLPDTALAVPATACPQGDNA
jgi:hypothetical protein